MTKPHLVDCPSCGRHVRVSEETCPFCSVRLDDAFRATPEPRLLTTRLGRAALFALGAGTVSVAVACGPAPQPVAPLYGGPPPTTPTPEAQPTTPDGGSSAQAVPDAGEAPPRPPMALYGGPPHQ